MSKQVYEWRKQRERDEKKLCLFCAEFFSHECSLDVLRVFLGSINILVLIQLTIGVGAVYLVQYYEMCFSLHASLIVSPIVFPLAFSINIDFQRREKIVEKLGDLKSSIMVFYFCMREWRHPSGLGFDWFNAIRLKLACFSLNVREYLVTEKVQRRKVILGAIYNDLGSIHSLFWKLRTSKMSNSAPLISRIIQTLTTLNVSFESMQNIREYRSSRAIRSFNKVMVFVLPVLLSPYFVDLGRKNDSVCSPYYISVVSVFIFSALQGVHDKLDNPFDGMGEDDVDLNIFEEWMFEILELNIITDHPRLEDEMTWNMKINRITPRLV